MSYLSLFILTLLYILFLISKSQMFIIKLYINITTLLNGAKLTIESKINVESDILV